MLTFNTLTRTNLEFPLSWHNLGIGTRDLHTREQASLVVSLNDISAVDLASTNATVVWSLWTWETSNGPAIRLVKHVEERVFLLQAEPWLVRLVGLHELSTLVAVVELVWGSIGVPALGDNQDVGSTTEWIGEDGNGAEVDIRVVTGSLASRATVEVPLGEIFRLEDTGFWDLGESLLCKSQSIFTQQVNSRVNGRGRLLTFDLDRVPPVESIQMYLIDRKIEFLRQLIAKNLLGHSTALLVEGHVLEELRSSQ